MIKPYKKDYDYSYTLGFYPTFELLKYRKDKLRCIYVSEDALKSEGYRKLANLVDSSKLVVSNKVFDKLKEKGNDHVIGVFDKYESKLEEDSNHVLLVNPSDQGNLGNIMRSMLAFSYRNLAIITPSADSWSPKVIRASMGARFAINVELFTSFDEYLKKYPRPYYPFMLQSSKPLKEIEKPKGNFTLVFGNEATGLSDDYLNENAVRIEQSDEVDSLNLATAVVVALYYLK